MQVEFAVVRVKNGELVQTLWHGKSIRQARTVIKNRRFLDDYDDLRIYRGTSSLDWEEFNPCTS